MRRRDLQGEGEGQVAKINLSSCYFAVSFILRVSFNPNPKSFLSPNTTSCVDVVVAASAAMLAVAAVIVDACLNSDVVANVEDVVAFC
jgi:hypothetical protein